MSAGDDQISLDDSSSFPDQVAVKPFFNVGVDLSPRAGPPLLFFFFRAQRLSFFNARILARRAERLRSAPWSSVSMRSDQSARAVGGRPPTWQRVDIYLRLYYRLYTTILSGLEPMSQFIRSAVDRVGELSCRGSETVRRACGPLARVDRNNCSDQRSVVHGHVAGHDAG